MSAETDELHLEDQVYLRTEFLERVAHELRGPAGVTLGALDEIEIALGDSAENVKTLMAMARRGARRVLRTAERLRRTAQLEGKSVEWARQPVDVKTVLEQAVRNAELVEARKGISLVVALPASPCIAMLDAAWVSAAVAELLVNAITRARKMASLQASLDGERIEIVITDDGAGFAEPPPPRFHPSRERRGLGLSFSMAEEVARAHDGEIVVDTRDPEDVSTPHGATVRILIPHHAHARAPAAE